MTRNEFIDFVLNEAHDAWLAKPTINPPVTAALAAHESAYGQSGLYLKAHNLFGIKGSYFGASITMPTKEVVNGNVVTVDAKFRRYPDARACIEDFQGIVERLSWYQDAEDAAAHARDFLAGLAAQPGEPGWATDPAWQDKVWRVVTQHDLRARWEVLKRRAPGTDVPHGDAGGARPAGRFSAVVFNPPYRKNDAAALHNAIADGYAAALRGPFVASTTPMEPTGLKLDVRRAYRDEHPDGEPRTLGAPPARPAGLAREPVAALALVRAAVVALGTVGVVSWTEAETNQVVMAAGALYAAAETIITILQRNRVTPTNSPRLTVHPE